MKNKPFLLLIFCACLALSATGHARVFSGRTIQLPVKKIAPGTSQIVIDFKLPANHEFAPEAPSTLFIRTKHPEILTAHQIKSQPLDVMKLPYSATVTASSGQTVVAIDARIHFCDEVTKICLSDLIRVKFPVQVEPSAPASIKLLIPLKSKTAA